MAVLALRENTREEYCHIATFHQTFGKVNDQTLSLAVFPGKYIYISKGILESLGCTERVDIFSPGQITISPVVAASDGEPQPPDSSFLLKCEVG